VNDSTVEQTDSKSDESDISSSNHSAMLWEIARGYYVDEEQQREDREVQKRFRQKSRGARLGRQMQKPSQGGKWHLSLSKKVEDKSTVLEPYIVSTDVSANVGPTAESEQGLSAEAMLSASTSASTLQTIEKSKLRPPPLQLVGKRNFKRSSSAKLQGETGPKSLHPSALPLPLNIKGESDIGSSAQHNEANFRAEKPKDALGKVLDSPSKISHMPIPPRADTGLKLAPGLIRHNGEILLRSAHSIPQNRASWATRSLSSASSHLWSDTDDDPYPETPPSSKTLRNPNGKEMEIEIAADPGSQNGYVGEHLEDEILDLYLEEKYQAVPPPVPEKSPQKVATASQRLGKPLPRIPIDLNHPSAEGMTRQSTQVSSPANEIENVNVSIPPQTAESTEPMFFEKSSNGNGNTRTDGETGIKEESDEERELRETEERHRRVAAILRRLRDERTDSFYE
jgi:hypothetical protein